MYADTDFAAVSSLDSNGNITIPLDQFLNQTPGMGNYSVVIEVTLPAGNDEAGQGVVTMGPFNREVEIRTKDLLIHGLDLDMKHATKLRLMIKF